MEIVHWFQNNWVGIVAVLLAVDNLLFALAPLTPWSWDDTLASRLKDIITRISGK